MRLTFIVTIDPVKDISLLNILILSLNLQTTKGFNVVFYNQTLMDEGGIFSRLTVKPTFDYLFYSIDKEYFLGKYPIWDLYEFHNTLLGDNVLNEYFMSLHVEEFLDVDYVENAIKVLQKNDFDIMFGNLARTQMNYIEIKPILAAETAEEFDRYLKHTRVKDACHWTFNYYPMFYLRNMNINSLKKNALKLFHFGFKKRVKPNERGFAKLQRYYEDVYFIKKEFAEQYNWFLRGHNMYFEDIQISEQKGVCELSKELRKITEFPIYFNLRRIYHIAHEKYYYQLVDDEFTTLMLNYETDDPILNALKKAIVMYREGELSLKRALTYTRKNSDGTGTQNLNYKYHMKYLNNSESK
jgi:hypothetical protein